jgi:D-alanine-D-alanine ligase
MGGASAEREVSLRSGAAIHNSLKGLGYNALSLDVGPDICAVLGTEGVEICFLALHGGYGENGSVQGMLEVLGIPYTGSGVLASALAMDKEASKKIFRYHDVPVPPFAVVQSSTFNVQCSREDKERVSNNEYGISFSLPWVIKPATEGSSVGVAIVKDRGNIEKALEAAFSYGPRAIIEQFISGKEIHIGIVNGKVLGGVEVRPSLEFYNYEAKYTAGLTQYILPPDIDDAVYAKAQETALAAHLALGCRGASRVDLILDTRGNPYALEVNTLPGMTETSLLPKIARLAGYDFPNLIEEMLRGVLDEDA